MTSKDIRLVEPREPKMPWKDWRRCPVKWQWKTVREDYSESGDAWTYFSHDSADSSIGCSRMT
jgi:hypothetical protein